MPQYDEINPVYPDLDRWIELHFRYEDDDPLHLRPQADFIVYPALDESGRYSDNGQLDLTDDEKAYFTKLIRSVIGDRHPEEMQKVMEDYHNAVDPDLMRFIADTVNDYDALPVTVGFIDAATAAGIAAHTRESLIGNRIVLSQDTLREILQTHDLKGFGYFKDIDDIARISYVLENHDSVADDGIGCKIIFTKGIGDMTYVIEVSTDPVRKRNYVRDAYCLPA